VTKELYTVPITFKLTESQYEPYKKVLETTKVKRGTLFREIFLAKIPNDYLGTINSHQADRVVFLANKTSNNLNQLARQVHSAHRSGVVSEKVFVEFLNRIISIEETFRKAIDKC
jgi:hypothetical protein